MHLLPGLSAEESFAPQLSPVGHHGRDSRQPSSAAVSIRTGAFSLSNEKYLINIQKEESFEIIYNSLKLKTHYENFEEYQVALTRKISEPIYLMCINTQATK